MTTSTRTLAVVSAVVFVFIGVVIGWRVSLAVVAVMLLLWLGYQLAGRKLAYDRQRLQAQRDALDAEWRALEQTGRVRSVFLQAQRAMRDEARRHRPDDERRA